MMGAKTLAERMRASGWFEAADILDKQAAELAALRAHLIKARDALVGGLWDYGPGQDEHAKCAALVEELNSVIAARAGGGK